LANKGSNALAAIRAADTISLVKGTRAYEYKSDDDKEAKATVDRLSENDAGNKAYKAGYRE
jgi:hypothetical protein